MSRSGVETAFEKNKDEIQNISYGSSLKLFQNIENKRGLNNIYSKTNGTTNGQSDDEKMSTDISLIERYKKLVSFMEPQEWTFHEECSCVTNNECNDSEFNKLSKFPISSSDESEITPHSVIFNLTSASNHPTSSISNSLKIKQIKPPPPPPPRQYFTTNKEVLSSVGEDTELRLKIRREFENELDLIVPVSDSNSDASSYDPQGGNLHPKTHFIHHDQSSSQHQNQRAKSQMREINLGEVETLNKEQYFSKSSNHIQLVGINQMSPICVQSNSSLTPDSNLKIENSTRTRRKGLLCQGLDMRQMCIICGFLIVASALGVGVGVPIAIEIQSHRSNSHKNNIVKKLLSQVPLIDGHNDLAWNLRKFLQNQLKEINFDSDLRQLEPFSGSPWSHTDLIRLKEGGVGAQLWSAYVPCSAQHLDSVQIAVEQIDVIKRLVEKYPAHLSLVDSVKEIERAHERKLIGSLIGVEGGHAIGNSLGVLRMLYNLGARYLTLTHNCNTPWADSASSENYLPERGGLTSFGKLVVLEMNRLGMIVDLAHVSVQTMKDALAITKAPVIFSHSAASALCNHSRNVPDDVLRLVAEKGGLVMVSFYNVFLACNESASIQDVIAHISHIRKVAGTDNVGIGAGFDGINFVPNGLEDVSKYPTLIETLLNDDSWSELDLKKLIGINFLRVFSQVEMVRDEWRRGKVAPIEEWIPKSDLQGHPTACTYYGSM